MRCAFLLFCLFTLPATVMAQEAAPAPQLDPGARVRVWPVVPGTTSVQGRVQSVTPEAVALTGGDGNAPRSFELTTLDRIDQSRGRNRWGWTGGGILVGAVAGVVVARSTREDDPADIGGIQNTADGIATTITAAFFGGVLGFLVAPERWRTIWEKR
ncbi:MAG TPA: hypothetical protein VGD27_10040 [Longimicrobiales bacterium]